MVAGNTRIGGVSPYAGSHYGLVLVVRALLAPLIAAVIVVLCAKGRWWGLTFLPFLTLDLWLLRRVVRYAHVQGR